MFAAFSLQLLNLGFSITLFNRMQAALVQTFGNGCVRICKKLLIFCISSLPFASATLFISSAKKASSYCSYSRSSSFMIFTSFPELFYKCTSGPGQFHSNTGRLTTEHLRKFCVRQIHQIFSVQQLPFFFAYFLKGG